MLFSLETILMGITGMDNKKKGSNFLLLRDQLDVGLFQSGIFHQCFRESYFTTSAAHLSTLDHSIPGETKGIKEKIQSFVSGNVFGCDMPVIIPRMVMK